MNKIKLLINKWKMKKNYKLFKKALKKELSDLHYYKEEEKVILRKPPISRSKRERFAYNELYSIAKASAYAEALFIIKNR